MSIKMAKPEHEILYQDLVKLIRKNADKMTSEEMLAVAANMLGKLIALQDQRTMSPAQAIQIVSANIEHGNQQVITELKVETKGTG